jgi:hypothetical protein
MRIINARTGTNTNINLVDVLLNTSDDTQSVTLFGDWSITLNMHETFRVLDAVNRWARAKGFDK